RLEELLQQCLLPGASGSVALASRPFTTYTGITVEQSAVFPSFALPKTHPLVTQARQTLSRALGREVAVDIWQFATDGGHLMAAGIPTVGFGPGDETLAHTNRERISLNALTDALAGYAALSAAGLPA
ncbi:MAG: M20/M25/M40 family metallo-hydrolase, partial [Anaerolineae bacterium]